MRSNSLIAGLLWLLAMMWPGVQAVAAQNDDLSWLLCSPTGHFDLSAAEVQALQDLGLLEKSGSGHSGQQDHCPFQGCIGSAHAAISLSPLPPMPVPVSESVAWLAVNPVAVARVAAISSPRNPRAPPRTI